MKTYRLAGHLLPARGLVALLGAALLLPTFAIEFSYCKFGFLIEVFLALKLISFS
jgi:hypothetical protein